MRRKRAVAVSVSFLAGAAVLVASTMYYPHNHHPFRITLDRGPVWAKNEGDRFDSQNSRSKTKCLLKIVHMEFFWDEVHEEESDTVTRTSVSREGERL